jgi:hypothetical protein
MLVREEQPLLCLDEEDTPPLLEGAKTRDQETSDGNDGETTSNARSKSKGRGHLRSAPTTA